MRKTVLGAVSATLLLSALPAVASAAIRVDGTHFAARGGTRIHHACSGPGVDPSHPATFRISETPRHPSPYGTRSVGWAPRESGFGYGPEFRVKTPSTLASTQIRLLAPDRDVSGQAVVDFAPSGEDGTWVGRYAIPDATGKGWHTIRVGNPTYQWTHYDADGNAVQGADDTLGNFVRAHGGDGDGARVGFMFGCDGNPFFVDGLSLTTTSGTRTYDFEGFRTRAVLSEGTKTPARILLKYGQGVVLTAHLRQAVADKAMAGAMRLDSRRLMSKKWGDHTTFRVSKKGHDVAVIPVRNTAYRLRFGGTGKYEASTSDIVKVLVRSKVRAGLVDATVVQGKAFTVTGRILPHRAATVVLQRFVNQKWTAIRRGKANRDGTFRISKTANTVGTSYWRILVGSGGGNVGNHSPTMTLTVKAPPSTTPPPPSDPPPPPPTH